MARINIEGSIYKEKGFQDLMINVGDRQKAKAYETGISVRCETCGPCKTLPI